MTIEIKELVIRAVVGGDEDAAPERETGEETSGELVDACVREVLRVLRRSRER